MLKPNLKWLIVKRGLTQKEVAKKMGVSKQQMNNWTSGRHFPTIDKCYKLAEILNTDISDLYEKIDNSGKTEKEDV